MRVLVISLLAVSFLFSACQTPEQKKEKLKQAALKKKAKTDLRANPDIDFQAFVVRLRKVVAQRDMETLKSMMTDDFGYKLDPPMAGPGVFQYWQQENLWPELDGILSEKFVKKGAFWVSPPQFADPSLSYDGYRAGITQVRGSWKFAYFVNG
jgi:hypothetical protein